MFSRTEWLAIFTMGFVSSLGPTYGVSGYLVGVIVSPYYFATPENRWSEFLHPYLPEFIFPQNRKGEMSWFYNGLPPDAAVPWESWAGPLFWWFTFIGAVAFACFCASIIIHRQWSEYEKLVYPAMEPIVEIASFGGSGKRLLPELMQGRMFWSGFFGQRLHLLLEYDRLVFSGLSELSHDAGLVPSSRERLSRPVDFLQYVCDLLRLFRQPGGPVQPLVFSTCSLSLSRES